MDGCLGIAATAITAVAAATAVVGAAVDIVVARIVTERERERAFSSPINM